MSFRRTALALSLAAAFSTGAQAAPNDELSTLKAELAKLLARVEQLEARNTQLEQAQAETAAALDEPTISAVEPPVASRLKAVESQANSQKKASKLAESLEGIEVGAGLTLVAQDASGIASNPDNPSGDDGAFNYRADLDVTVPLDSLGNASESKLYGQFRIGQGRGIEELGNGFASPNATTFQRPGSEDSDSTVLLAQAWYQVDLPLPLGGNPDLSREHLEFTVGKMDPFAFFDGNAIADDETSRFMNQAFVHNPLLDVGGDIGVDEFGFTPGLRLAYVSETRKPETYGISLGVFGSGEGASYKDSLQSPLVLVQAETTQFLFDGLRGNYRLYAWQNGRGEEFVTGPDTLVSLPDGSELVLAEGEPLQKTHRGLGLSVDQQLHDYTTVFARYGKQLDGKSRFDQALTLGAEFGGSYWNRGADALGLALGWLQVSDEFQDASRADESGELAHGYEASGSEQIGELYYRYFVNGNLALSPNFQYIRRPGGDADADDVRAVGLRAQLDY
ncbi:MAG: carbohydrate porin [Gammaproteobacteria bacterium]|nr:carbohydrate porin [Gammaproteobacteria bacterium]